MSNELNIDQGTLNGFGIITVDLLNNYVKSIQYTDLNTDYYIIRIIAASPNKTYYCVTNYDLTYINNENIDVIAGPFAIKDDAIAKITFDYPSTDGYIVKNNVFINLSINSNNNKITFTEVSKSNDKIMNNFTFFSPVIHFINN